MNKIKVLSLLLLLGCFSAKANNMLIQNVSKVGNNPTAKTIQIQFDISWQNSWRDSINYDAAWIFIKYKDANGLWQHAKLNLSGYQNGTGTANTLSVQSDSVGAFMYRNAMGNGAFASTGVQLQWNYGSYGLTDVSAFEIRVFAIEMVYVPQGDFNVAKSFYDVHTDYYADSLVARGSNFPVINTHLSPTIIYKVTYGDTASVRIKGDAGIDTNNDGIIDNTSFPTGYKPFYCYKYELSEDQYADFYNTLTQTQQTNIGLAGYYITQTNGTYYSSIPNFVCVKATEKMVLAYSAWSGMRPMSILEFNKASYGPFQPVYNNAIGESYNRWINGFPAWSDAYSTSISVSEYNGNYMPSNVGSRANSTSTRIQAGASYYGIMDLTGNAIEPVVRLSYSNFSNQNGNGTLPASGNAYGIANWNTGMLIFIDQVSTIAGNGRYQSLQGFRYVRSAE